MFFGTQEGIMKKQPQTKPPPEWLYTALTNFPKSEEKRGKVRAFSIEEAIKKIREKNLFPILVQLSPQENKKNTQARSISRQLDKSQTRRKLIKEGVLLPIETKKGGG